MYTNDKVLFFSIRPSKITTPVVARWRPLYLGSDSSTEGDFSFVSITLRLVSSSVAKNPGGEAACYFDFSAELDYEIIFRRRSANSNADAFRRVMAILHGEPRDRHVH